MKTTATYTGMPLCIKRRITGIIPHSHSGKIMPTKQANRMPSIGFLGIKRRIVCSETNICSKPETNTPSKTKGKASRTMLKKIVLKLCTFVLVMNEKSRVCFWVKIRNKRIRHIKVSTWVLHRSNGVCNGHISLGNRNYYYSLCKKWRT